MRNALVLTIVIIGLLALASCGTAALTPAGNPSAGGTASPGASVPGLPLDASGEVTRGASEVLTIPGSDVVASSGGTVDGTSILLQSTETELAWAMYKVEGLVGRNVTSLGIQFKFNKLAPQYSVAVGNFSDGIWDYLQPGALPEFEFDLSGEQSRLVSKLGNLYFLVVVSGGDQVTVDSAGVISEPETVENEKLPGMGMRPEVSEGLPDRIEISWVPVVGAESYELQRMTEAGDARQWDAIATQAETSYTDTAIALGAEYKYRVRAVNGAGAGNFGRERSGFAGTPPAGGEDTEDSEFSGAVEAIGASSFTVAGQELKVTELTRFIINTTQEATFADLTVGATVEAQADPDGTGGWIATLVDIDNENENETEGGDDASFTGAIDSISATEVLIAGQAIAIDAQTKLFLADGTAATLADFEAGDTAEAQASSNGAGGWLATTLTLEDNGGQGGHGGGGDD